MLDDERLRTPLSKVSIARTPSSSSTNRKSGGDDQPERFSTPLKPIPFKLEPSPSPSHGEKIDLTYSRPSEEARVVTRPLTFSEAVPEEEFRKLKIG